MTDRGAADGPPVAIATEERTAPSDELRIGPLPEPTLFERLRSSWSLEALIPSFEPDPSMPPRKGFRIAGALALVVHAGFLVAIVLFARYGIMPIGEEPEKPYAWVAPNDYRVTDNPDSPGTDAPSTGGGRPEGGAPDGGGGSNTQTNPVTAGAPPATSPNPVPLAAPPPMNVSLPLPPTVLGPDMAIPPPVNDVGLPGAPTAPDDPSSAGNAGGRGVGTGNGDGAGTGTGPGAGTGPGGGRGGPAGSGPGGTRGGGPPGGESPGPGIPGGGGVQNRGVRFVKKVAPKIPAKMAEKGSFGTVRLKVTIGPDGSILSVVPINTLADGGTQAAIDSIYRCKFQPAIRNGVAVTETIVVAQNISPLTGYKE